MSGRIDSPGPFNGASSRDSSRGRLPSFPMTVPHYRTALCFLWVLVLTSALAAQPRPGQRADEVVLRAYTFKHQRASEAVPLVYPLLSGRGTVELQPATNTLVIRDTLAALSRIVPVLHNFDHPARPVRLEVIIVKASRNQVSPPVRKSDLPDQLTRRLRQLLPYDIYEMQAQAQLRADEGQSVIYELGEEYEVSFRLGTLLDGERIKLSNFRIRRRSERPGANLIHTNLNLRVDQTMNLGLAKNELSRDALMVVLTLRSGESPRRPQP
jgi:hypothetical protein